MPEKEKLWAIVPAAGAGQRLPGVVPKQYLHLQGKAIIEHSLGCLLNELRIEWIVVALNRNDQGFSALEIANHPRVKTTLGGAERAESVLNGLQALAEHAAADDWVLVHDAARPCLPQSDLSKLLESGCAHDVGAILAAPVVDTIKRGLAATQEISETVDRQQLWRALTPQLFRYGLLKSALEHCQNKHLMVTDEASAVEHLGKQPLLVPGQACNIKVTYPEDVALAEFYLQDAVVLDERKEKGDRQ
ncbi:2-C-methyl-D-erythritol 4-phosphate cytidylyltransferase [Spongiibacter sp. IMCC21906]|uniref:2-C-methyl-D-erythritol 4-phosphate cytidylyltransferase n=1 Tax=Spongiibacter sp. IMCC21906 TaxID=1620392 RepID=UPI00062DEC75|nr:2-C-methyl-D-erythritol 4-phosphate cytidylyltransferase [Spongiibacter sp. IMCC21906]AKH69570.1 2-C-methyl-D-erythritol 4-phosphate cytidylyltransferase [Spongiibacter sp. IMCC21906]